MKIFDYKKEYKEFYAPKATPSIVNIPPMNFIAVRGKGNPNYKDGEYQKSIALLYAIAYTLKMSYKSNYKIDGFFEYVVPPLEGFWWQEGLEGYDASNKDALSWISVIRIPDFIREKDFAWAVEVATKKKKQDFSKVEFFTYAEGLCVQCLHIGAFDEEPATVRAMEECVTKQGCKVDLSTERLHHEIYLSDLRKTETHKLKTIIRYPIK